MPLGSVVVADHQTAGRGRHGRSWEAPPGSGLFVTFVLPHSPLVVFAAGVAAAEACGGEVLLKWPNDHVLHEGKLGGLLAEIRNERAAVGIGSNLSRAPHRAARLGRGRDGPPHGWERRDRRGGSLAEERRDRGRLSGSGRGPRDRESGTLHGEVGKKVVGTASVGKRSRKGFRGIRRTGRRRRAWVGRMRLRT